MPSVQFPPGQSVVNVTIIDNGARIKGPVSFFLDGPPLLAHLSDGEDALGAPAYVFLIEHATSGRKLVFDLGIRSDFEAYSPHVKAYHKAFTFETGEDISQFLQSRNMALDTIEAVIWSHHHIDHVGNPAGFNPQTDLVVGPGFKETVLPGYPANPDSLILESDYQGRNIRELDFSKESKGLEICGFRAIDYFGDGSFYLLETPGHTIDHICALARTSSDGTSSQFILMGGDLGHHASQWRPNRSVPLPAELTPSPLGPDWVHNVRRNVCPCHLFLDHVHPHGSPSGATTPFLGIRPGHPYDADQASQALQRMSETLDADDNVMVIMAHDWTLLPTLKFWPETANSWHEEGWKERGRWEFLKDFGKHVEDKAEPGSQPVTTAP